MFLIMLPVIVGLIGVIAITLDNSRAPRDVKASPLVHPDKFM